MADGDDRATTDGPPGEQGACAQPEAPPGGNPEQPEPDARPGQVRQVAIGRLRPRASALGRPRVSTVVLSTVWIVLFVLYLEVRPGG
jgi:hypothetical protein